MIKLDISVALFFYLFFTVILVFGLWIWFDRGSRLKLFKSERRNVWQCSVCKYVYTDENNDEFSRCPRCNSINKREVKNS